MHISGSLSSRSKWLLLFSALLLLGGCGFFRPAKTEFDASEFMAGQIYQKYDFEADGNQLKVSASFRKGGKCETTETELARNIKFNGEELKQEPFNDPCNAILASFHFIKTFPQSFDKGAFTFSDSGGMKYSLNVDAPQAFFGEFETPVDFAKTIKVPVKNFSDLEKGEWKLRIRSQAVLFLYGESKSEDFLLTKDAGKNAYLDSKAESLIIKPSLWDNFHTGSIIYLQLIGNFPCNQDSKPLENGRGIECGYKTAETAINNSKPISQEEMKNSAEAANKFFNGASGDAKPKIPQTTNSNSNSAIASNKATPERKPKEQIKTLPSETPRPQAADGNSPANR